VFVADFGNGVRRIDRSGVVSTVILPKGRGLLATSVATDVEAGHDVLLVALETGIARLDLTAGTSSFFAAGLPAPGPAPDSSEHVFMEGRPNLGSAYGVAPLGDERFLYTDLRDHVLRVVWGRHARVLAGSGDDDASYTAGAFRDGNGPVARFDLPLGIARIAADRFAIADAGNRRIRLVRVPQGYGETFDDLAAAKGFYRIVYVGNSYVDYASDDRTSIATLLSAGLRSRALAGGFARPPRVFTFKLIADAPAIGSFIRNYCAGVADLVIWQVNAAELPGFQGILGGIGEEISPRADVWRPALQHELRATRDELTASHTAFLVALNPMPWEISPIESAYQRLYELQVPPYAKGVADGALLRSAVTAAGVEAVDMFPAFLLSERQANRGALFASLDHHFSEAGRRLVASSLLDSLARLKPWATAH
jgi:hypothetical protein